MQFQLSPANIRTISHEKIVSISSGNIFQSLNCQVKATAVDGSNSFLKSMSVIHCRWVVTRKRELYIKRERQQCQSYLGYGLSWSPSTLGRHLPSNAHRKSRGGSGTYRANHRDEVAWLLPDTWKVFYQLSQMCWQAHAFKLLAGSPNIFQLSQAKTIKKSNMKK